MTSGLNPRQTSSAQSLQGLAKIEFIMHTKVFNNRFTSVAYSDKCVYFHDSPQATAYIFLANLETFYLNIFTNFVIEERLHQN